MKKLFIIFIYLLFTTFIFATDFSLGIKCNLGWNKFVQKTIINEKEEGDVDENYGYRLGNKVGIIFGIQISDIFAFEPELLVHFGNGYSISEEEDGFSSYYTLSFTTIELPLMIKTKFPLGPGYFAFATGPNFCYAINKINESLEYKIENTTGDSSNTLTLEDKNMKNLYISFAVGAEYGLPLGPGDLIFGGRWEIDLTNIYDNSNSPENINHITRRISIMPSIAYMFKF